MYEYIPPKTNKKAQWLCMIFLLGGFALIAIPNLLAIPFGGFIQLVGLCFLILSILLVARYLVRDFEYRVEPTEEGGTDFCVSEIHNRKRKITVCRIALEDIQEAVSVDSFDQATVKAVKTRIRAEKRKLFSYCPDLAPAHLCYLFAEDPSAGPIVIVICPDETLLRLLTPPQA